MDKDELLKKVRTIVSDKLSISEEQVTDEVRVAVESAPKEGGLVLACGNTIMVGVKYINSCGLGSLICALTTLRKTGGDIRLVGLGEHIREILEITRLNRTFEIYPSLKDALQELNVTMN